MTLSLPDLDLFHGYLPPGLHPADIPTLRRRFVDELLSAPMYWDTTRRSLFAGYLRLVEALQLMELPTEQWIGGSFISGFENPKDIDLVNFCDASAYQALPVELKAMIQRYFKGEETAAHCGCDSYFVPQASPDHPRYADFAELQRYWMGKLGSGPEGIPKGIVQCQISLPEPVEATEGASDAEAD